ncbi:MAG: hypothetical protein ACRD8Z_24620 [Nitrososphaeraceae archaeon]
MNILNNPTYTTKLLSSVTMLTVLVSSCILCQPFLSSQFHEAEGSNSNQSSTQPSLPEIGTRFEAVGGIFNLPSINCLECEFRGIVEKSTASTYNMRGEVVGDSVSIVIPVLVLGTLNIHGSAINGILTISDKEFIIEGTSTTYSPTCSYCKQILDLRGQSVQGDDDVMSANLPLNIIK